MNNVVVELIVPSLRYCADDERKKLKILPLKRRVTSTRARGLSERTWPEEILASL